MLFIIDGVMEFTRQELINWLVEYIEENEFTWEDNAYLLPQYPIRRSCNHHPVKIARGFGFEVTVVTR